MSTERKPSGVKRDFREDLTNKIIKLIEQGTAPWQKPWNGATNVLTAMPHNMVSKHRYRGGNVVNLMIQSMEMGYDDPRWCTYKQAQEKGWQVRKGEKGTTVEYWKFGLEVDDETVEGGKRKLERPVAFYATVFNASQIDGVPELTKPKPSEWESHKVAEYILQNSGVPIRHDQLDRAFYRPVQDSIHLPSRASFPTAGDYYEVAMHELGHATGHESRLARDLTGQFGSPSYAAEELRAQMCSLFLTAELGIPFNPERHAAYQESWVEKLKSDKNEIFRAARDAELMADFVLDIAPEYMLQALAENGQEQEAPGRVNMLNVQAMLQSQIDNPSTDNPVYADLMEAAELHADQAQNGYVLKAGLVGAMNQAGDSFDPQGLKALSYKLMHLEPRFQIVTLDVTPQLSSELTKGLSGAVVAAYLVDSNPVHIDADVKGNLVGVQVVGGQGHHDVLEAAFKGGDVTFELSQIQTMPNHQVQEVLIGSSNERTYEALQGRLLAALKDELPQLHVEAPASLHASVRADLRQGHADLADSRIERSSLLDDQAKMELLGGPPNILAKLAEHLERVERQQVEPPLYGMQSTQLETTQSAPGM